MEINERESMHEELNNVRTERDNYKLELEKLETLLRQSRLQSFLVEGNDVKYKFYTGLSWIKFEETFNYLVTFMEPVKPGRMPAKDQFFLTLVRLRQSPSFEYLADQTGVGKSTVVDIFWRWLKLIQAKLSFVIQWPDREVIRNIPPVFKRKFPRLTNIIDCFEIFIESPKNLKARAECYSNYKKHTTVKFLIACSPIGAIIFLSKAWGGRVSDIEVSRSSGYINPRFHQPGDQILADRGFTLKDDLASQCSAELLTPAFTKGKKQLSAQEVEMSRALSSIRIHVERVIGLLKSRFTILQGVLPIQIVNSAKSESLDSTLSSIDTIVQSCAILANLSEGIVFK